MPVEGNGAINIKTTEDIINKIRLPYKSMAYRTGQVWNYFISITMRTALTRREMKEANMYNDCAATENHGEISSKVHCVPINDRGQTVIIYQNHNERCRHQT